MTNVASSPLDRQASFESNGDADVHLIQIDHGEILCVLQELDCIDLDDQGSPFSVRQVAYMNSGGCIIVC